MGEPKLGDRCTCLKHGGVWHPHTVASDCKVMCSDECDALVMPLTMDDFRKALIHWRDHH